MLSALSDYTNLNKITEALAKPFIGCQIQKVACFEALGFPLGAGVALTLKAGLVLVRKKKESDEDSSDFETETFCDYDKLKTFRVLKRTVPSGTRILVVDDLYETGNQLRAAINLLTRLGATATGAAFICCRGSEDVNLDPCYGFHVHHLNGREDLIPFIGGTD